MGGGLGLVPWVSTAPCDSPRTSAAHPVTLGGVGSLGGFGGLLGCGGLQAGALATRCWAAAACLLALQGAAVALLSGVEVVSVVLP